MKKFDFVVGNPPYQDETIGDNKTYAPPVYNFFLENTFKISDATIMIHPARFLFNAGSTPAEWNRKMLTDKHFKVLKYESNSKIFFENQLIKGGIVITYRDKNKIFEPIEIFTPYYQLNKILKKVIHRNEESLSKIAISSYSYHFNKVLYDDFPEAKGRLSKGHELDLKSNLFEKLPMIFEEKSSNTYKIIGRLENIRTHRYINKKYITKVINLNKYKVFLSGAIGDGSFGEKLSTPIIGFPGYAATETFMSIGIFDNLQELENCIKYIKSKFARSLLGIKKSTQANTPGKWEYVPLQDFTENSDIDWSKSISEIDQQLYKKYGLSDEEIAFIEEKVQEME
ncbi:MAG: Eco57I restriction-modification methylase domain-containing protein [Anaerococcus sp.]|jgi:hypothetical protein|uniref:Eco57I restriction-modification methylase domain-containing protein n=1 Tax=Anaerococcus sp. TaxID=1872515 RepID=UPI002900D5ED|nr:Eco57I restriction-modification methylase domain-containing protein [Anaerococcus sp.]MDU2565006.1 Eco57I restriction-modification methylase domain-containing protein [Anaerococcus sp.]